MLVPQWLVLTIAAQLLRMAGSETSPPSSNDLLGHMLEGSGYGSTDDFDALDLADIFDESNEEEDNDNNYYNNYNDYDDDDYDYDYDDDDDYDHDGEMDEYDDFYDGLNTGDDDVDYPDSENGGKGAYTNSYQDETVTCFRCLGDGSNGCNITDMLRDMVRFTVTCTGKCLNISTGSIAVYDCARDLATKENLCLDDFDTRMCFCEGDLCNRPADISEDVDTLISRIERLTKNISKESSKPHDNETPSSQRHDHKIASNQYTSANYNSSVAFTTNSDKDSRLSNGIPLKNSMDRNTIPLTSKDDQSQGTATDGQNQDLPYQFVSEAEIDIVIPEKGSADSDKLSNEDESMNASSDDVQSLSVASLRDGSSGWSNHILRLNVMVILLTTCFRFVVDFFVLR